MKVLNVSNDVTSGESHSSKWRPVPQTSYGVQFLPVYVYDGDSLLRKDQLLYGDDRNVSQVEIAGKLRLQKLSSSQVVGVSGGQTGSLAEYGVAIGRYGAIGSLELLYRYGR